MLSLRLPQTGQVIELYVTHINRNGKVYAQLNSLCRNCLMSHMPVNEATCSSVSQISFTVMYLVKCGSQLHRARITDVPDRNKLTVLLVDLGRAITIWKQDLLYTESMVLQSIPPQVGI